MTDFIRENSKTAKQMLKAKKAMEAAQENMRIAIELGEKAQRRVELREFLDKYSLDEIKDVYEEIKEENENDGGVNENESSSVSMVILDDTSDDEYKEAFDGIGPINEEECDEVFDTAVFSNDGETASKEIIDRIKKEQELHINPRDGGKWYSIKKGMNELIIQNVNKGRQEYGLLTSSNLTPLSDIVNNWDKFGRNQAKRRKYDFKGKNIEEVIQMIHNILS